MPYLCCTPNLPARELPYYINIVHMCTNMERAQDILNADAEDMDMTPTEAIFFGTDNEKDPTWIVQGCRVHDDYDVARFGDLHIYTSEYLSVEVYRKENGHWYKECEFPFFDEDSAMKMGMCISDKLQLEEAYFTCKIHKPYSSSIVNCQMD